VKRSAGNLLKTIQAPSHHLQDSLHFQHSSWIELHHLALLLQLEYQALWFAIPLVLAETYSIIDMLLFT
jgi:hypothetical protein